MGMGQEVEACIRSEFDRLVGAVSMVTGSVPLAEDAVQEAFARAWERSQRGETFDHLAGWVATVALNLAKSGRRRRRTERRAIGRLAAWRPSPSAEWSHLREVVGPAIDALPRRQRDAVCLYYLLDLDVKTVADLLDVSTGTVKTALSRARSRLADVLAEQELDA